MDRYSITAAPATAAAIVPAEDLKPALVSDFISFIDRGEKTTRTYLTNLKQFFSWLAFEGITRPARADIILYREHITREHKANTVKQYLQSVRQFFAWTAASGLYPNIAANIHAPKIKNDIHRKEALTPADVLRIEQSIATTAAARTAEAGNAVKDKAGRIDRATEQGKRLFAMYVLAVNAGLRTVEISRARVKDLEERNGKAVLYVWGKGHEEADAKKPLAPAVYDAIKDYLQSRSDRPTANSPLFISTGNRSGGKAIAATTISKMLKQAMKEAGYNSERITAHSLRHTAGNSVLTITDTNIYMTQMYMRHASPKTTEIYIHKDTETQDSEIAEKLYNYYHAAAMA